MPPLRHCPVPAAALLVVSLAACRAAAPPAAAGPETATAARQRIVVEVEATGVVTPVDAIDVRSKASGQIVELPVQTGTVVRRGDLLVRIDPRDPQNRYDQAVAAVQSARAAVQVAQAQFDRTGRLVDQGVLTLPDLEAVRVALADAHAQAAAAKTTLELAQIALEDVTIRAPSPGVVIARAVAAGQVVASATQSPSGGTVLLTLADLSTVYDSVLVNESDIGRIRPGQEVSVTADAHPGRIFKGRVTKVEPRATIQQSVTFFPVLIALDNRDGALMPGMNTDVSVLVAERDGALVVPVDAVRTLREAGTVAQALGLDPERVRALVQGGTGRPTAGGDSGTGRQVSVRRGGGARGGAGDGPGPGRATTPTAVPAGRGVLFVRGDSGIVPRVVTTGLRNYDVVEVTGGLAEGERVMLVSGALMQAARTKFQGEIRSRTGMPGMGGGGGGAGGGTGGGAGGGGGRPRGGS